MLAVRAGGRDAGTATPYQITRHAHPKARPEATPGDQPRPTGIDYLALIDAQHTRAVAGRVNYAALAGDDDQGDQGDQDQKQQHEQQENQS